MGSQNPTPRTWNYVKKTIEFTENYKLYNMKKIPFFFSFLSSTIEFSITWNTVTMSYINSYKVLATDMVSAPPRSSIIPFIFGGHFFLCFCVLFLPMANNCTFSEACAWVPKAPRHFSYPEAVFNK